MKKTTNFRTFQGQAM